MVPESKLTDTRKTPKGKKGEMRGSVVSEKNKSSALTGTIKEFTYLPREFSEQDLVRVNSGKVKKVRKQSATKHKLDTSPFALTQKLALAKKMSQKGQDSPTSSRKHLGSP